RARRRALQQGQPERQAAILEEIERRDALDSGREVAPLREAEDAQVVVAEGRSAEDVADLICALVDERREPPPLDA
ncbi:MAG: (d)CMP kinase, partial [Planctomycetota bacterium]